MEYNSEVQSAVVNSIAIDNISYAKRLAHRFYQKRAHTQAEADDIVSSAYLGLCEAASRYEESKGDNFHTYSYFRIVGSMYEYLRVNGGLSRTEYKKIVEEKDEKRADDERQIHFAKNTHQLSQLKSVIEAWGVSVNVDNENGNVDLTYVEQSLPDEDCERQYVYEKLRQAIEELPCEMRQVLIGRYFEDKTLNDLAIEYPELSKSYLSRLHSKALISLRRKLAAYV